MHNPTTSLDKSDPISYNCTCPARAQGGGTVLLFYRYWQNSPPLPAKHASRTTGPQALADWHSHLTAKLGLRGKIRIAKEGFNVTVGGTRAGINEYVRCCREHWSFDGLESEELGTEDVGIGGFFKPSDGCACVFDSEGTGASVRVTAEITPMGVEGYMPRNWEGVEVLLPEEFHQRCHEERNVLLVDVRNHYESKIGYFVDPRTGEAALRPQIRRFSQWPQYLRRHGKDLRGDGSCTGRQIMTYCTGGIRCEKGVRWMQENININVNTHQQEKVCTLRGGIAAYLAWMDEEIRRGTKQASDSLFRGRNYVFDARGSTGLTAAEIVPVSACHICSAPTDSLSKCRSSGCHLVLVVCSDCDQGGDPRCCQSCSAIDDDQSSELCETERPRQICACEQAREELLWGGERVKMPKTEGWRKEKRKKKRKNEAIGCKKGIDIQVRITE